MNITSEGHVKKIPFWTFLWLAIIFLKRSSVPLNLKNHIFPLTGLSVSIKSEYEQLRSSKPENEIILCDVIRIYSPERLHWQRV